MILKRKEKKKKILQESSITILFHFITVPLFLRLFQSFQWERLIRETLTRPEDKKGEPNFQCRTEEDQKLFLKREKTRQRRHFNKERRRHEKRLAVIRGTLNDFKELKLFLNKEMIYLVHLL